MELQLAPGLRLIGDRRLKYNRRVAQLYPAVWEGIWPEQRDLLTRYWTERGGGHLAVVDTDQCHGATMNAGTLIVLSAKSVQQMPDKPLGFLLAHETGHCLQAVEGGWDQRPMGDREKNADWLACCWGFPARPFAIWHMKNIKSRFDPEAWLAGRYEA